MDAARTASQFRRQQRSNGKLALVGIFSVVAISWAVSSPNETDPAVVQSGDYQLAAINSDASLRIIIPQKTPMQIDVRWLGIEITNLQATVNWIQSKIHPADSVHVRMDRRRLDAAGNVTAYFFLDDMLLNAELIRLGFAMEATHPSDYAPIARQLRQAASTDVARK